MDIKKRIIKDARYLFITFGIRSVTMDTIAEEIGMSKRTIYENFKDKDDLLKQCIEVAMSNHRDISEDIINNSENIIEATFKFIKNSISIINKINPLFFFDIKKYYPELFVQKIKESDIRSHNRIAELLKRGIKEDLFRSDINVEIVTKLILEQFKMLSNNELFPSEKFSKIDVFENIVINFIRGISTKKGLQLIEEYSS